MFGRRQNLIAAFVCLFTGITSVPALAATASFSAPVATPSDIAGSPDGNGVLITPGLSALLIVDPRFATAPGETVEIFAVTGGPGSANARLTFGQFDGTTFSAGHSQVFNSAGGSVSLNFLFFTGCAPLGCNAIQVESLAAFAGATGFALDAVSVGGTFLTAATNPVSSAPEPTTWALMILGFMGLAWRMKAGRRNPEVESHWLHDPLLVAS
ncbi:MAG: PEP-CTERM sorting domain-containing protein [Pseudomonadota bacterium]